MQKCSCYQQGRRDCWGALSLLLILITSFVAALSDAHLNQHLPASRLLPLLNLNRKTTTNQRKTNTTFSTPDAAPQVKTSQPQGVTKDDQWKDFKLFKWSLGLSSILSSEQCTETTHILILLSLISMNTEKCGDFLVKNDAPTFNVTLWSLSPARMLVPLPISSSMPRWALCRDSLNCKVSSIGMVVSESCGESRGSVTCSLRNTACSSTHGQNPTGLGGLCLHFFLIMILNTTLIFEWKESFREGREEDKRQSWAAAQLQWDLKDEKSKSRKFL